MDRPGIETHGERPVQLDGTLRSAISQAVVRIHAEHYGKGATQAKTYSWDDVVVTVLADVLTTAERTLVSVERPDAVRDVRGVYRDTMAPRFCAAIEEITGRRVRSSMGQIDPVTGYGVEVFVLEPVAPRGM